MSERLRVVRGAGFKTLKARLMELLYRLFHFCKQCTPWTIWNLRSTLDLVFCSCNYMGLRKIGFRFLLLIANKKSYKTHWNCLAVWWAELQLRPYLQFFWLAGLTDQEHLRWVLRSYDSMNNSTHWQLSILKFEFDVIHETGIMNEAADSLSQLLKMGKNYMQQRRDSSNVPPFQKNRGERYVHTLKRRDRKQRRRYVMCFARYSDWDRGRHDEYAVASKDLVYMQERGPYYWLPLRIAGAQKSMDNKERNGFVEHMALIFRVVQKHVPSLVFQRHHIACITQYWKAIMVNVTCNTVFK